MNKKYKFSQKIMFLVLLVTCNAVSARADFDREYQLKAAYLLNFSRFVYWSEEQINKNGEDFNICIYGDSPFEKSLDRLTGKSIRSKKIKVLKVNGDNFKYCNIIYISDSESKKYVLFLKKTSKFKILTVSDIDGFAKNGGMIEFVRVKNKIKFEINVKQSLKSGIKYRTQLLEVAEKVR